MKLSIVIAAAIATLASAAVESGEVQMERLMALKQEQRRQQKARGWFGGSSLYKRFNSFNPCVNGRTVRPGHQYSCRNVNMHGFLSHEDMGSKEVQPEGNDAWGWTSPLGRQFAIVGQSDGTAFVEVDALTGALDYIGRLPTQTSSAIWRDIKVIGNHAYIGSEAPGHGLQIFNLNKLLRVKPSRLLPVRRPVTFSTTTDITWYGGFGASHNIVAHEETNMIYAVGGREGANSRNTTCAGGLFMVDVSNPSNPVSPGCVGQDGYVHDAQCVIYTGPDQRYQQREICFGFNEDSLTVYDLTDKNAPEVLSVTPYVGVSYAHQGWLIDNANMEWLLLDDELDEMDRTSPGADSQRTTTYIFNVADLTAPRNTGFYQSPVRSIDHNQYIINGISYQSNYMSGLRILDVNSIPRDPTGAGIKEIGFFDVHPEDDDGPGEVEFAGAWNVYPYFKSGHLIINSIERGVFSVKYAPKRL